MGVLHASAHAGKRESDTYVVACVYAWNRFVKIVGAAVLGICASLMGYPRDIPTVRINGNVHASGSADVYCGQDVFTERSKEAYDHASFFRKQGS